MPSPTYPSYMDNDFYSIEGDLVELRRHVSHLLDDLTFCTEHNAMRAIAHFDDRVHETYNSIGRRGKRGLIRARLLARRHPRATLLVIGATGLAIGLLLLRGTAARPAL